jgi:hypothetical protein
MLSLVKNVSILGEQQLPANCNMLTYRPLQANSFPLNTTKNGDMQSFDIWLKLLSKDLSDLKQLEKQDAPTRLRRSLKEQEIGQHCCEAGENLDDAQLSRLKGALGLTEQEWQAYKSKVRPEPE